jgi:Yip1 domain
MQFNENPYAPPQFPAEKEIAHSTTVEIKNPWLSIWFYPRDTIRWVVQNDPHKHVTLLICLGGILQMVDRATTKNLGDVLPLSGVLAVIVLVGPILGLFGTWLLTHGIRITGFWLGGKGDRRLIRAATAWASVPVLTTLVTTGIYMSLLGREGFQSSTPYLNTQPWLQTTVNIIGWIELTLTIWSLLLQCNTIAEVQGFRSAWSGFLNLLLAVLSIVILGLGFIVLWVVAFPR